MWMQCDEDFIVKTVDLPSFDVHEVDGEKFYPISHLASVNWFSQAQLRAFANWLGDSGIGDVEDLQQLKWIGPRDRPELRIGFSPDGEAFVNRRVVIYPKSDDKRCVFKGVFDDGVEFVCLHDVAAVDNTDPSNMELFELISKVAEDFGIDINPFE
jgi:hypothetical protein